MSETPQRDTRPFSAFERLVARRYLRARRREGFISVIAGLSFLGIMLGVATLIGALFVAIPEYLLAVFGMTDPEVLAELADTAAV